MISDFSRDILSTFQVRKKRKDKDRFIELLRTRFPELKVEENSFPFRTRNIVLGDLDKAKIVLTAHYDTQARMIIPNFIAPNNKLISYAYQIGLGGLIGLCTGFLVGLFSQFTIARLIPIPWLAEFSTVALTMFIFLWLLILGPANKHTANDNTSGVITLITLLENMSREQREKCCFVFFDLEEAGLWGSRAFAKMHKDVMKDKLLMNFDCVSDGEYCLLINKEAAGKKYLESMQKSFVDADDVKTEILDMKKCLYPSDQNNFPCSSAVVFCKKKKVVGYYVDKIHTAKDVVFEERNIEYLENTVKDFVDTL